MLRTIKTSVAVSLIITLASLANAQGKSDRALDGLAGPVKSTQTENVLMECVSGEFVEDERSTSSEKYDLSGRVIGNRNRFSRSDPISRMLYYPFEEGVTRIEKNVLWENGIPSFWKHGALIYTDVYTYDNKSRLAQHVNYRADGTVQSRSIVIFNEQGEIAETKRYNADGALSGWNKIEYDARGNEVESVYFKEDGSLVDVSQRGCSYLHRFVFSYEFDSAGNWIRQVISKPVLKDGKFIVVPYAFKNRTITYY
ncbi:MAG TPA: hypothetical protein VJU86_06455 [Pyrinomonadaceae bacterium]|nr:hypothetical protein [Pyrinomonadaceae bacterium]